MEKEKSLSFEKTNEIAVFQEMSQLIDSRTIDLSKVEAYSNGHHSIQVIADLLKNDILAKLLPEHFVKFAREEIELAQNKINSDPGACVMHHAIRIWTAPKFEKYSGAEEIDASAETLSKIQDILNDVDFEICVSQKN